MKGTPFYLDHLLVVIVYMFSPNNTRVWLKNKQKDFLVIFVLGVKFNNELP
jgi:hypothetical protein